MALMLGDCLDRMHEIEDASVDMILCDLPYETTRNEWDFEVHLPAL
jgi:DNA modification methylase